MKKYTPAVHIEEYADLLEEIIESVDQTYQLNEPSPEEIQSNLEHKRSLNRKRIATYRKRHPEKIRARAHRKRAREINLNSHSDYTEQDIQLQYQSQKGLCWWCGKPLKGKYHIDHRIPLTRGGNNTARNICLTHAKCNLKRKNRMPWECSDRLL